MSDAEPDKEVTENPEPESDATLEADTDTQPESEHQSDNPGPEVAEEAPGGDVNHTESQSQQQEPHADINGQQQANVQQISDVNDSSNEDSLLNGAEGLAESDQIVHVLDNQGDIASEGQFNLESSLAEGDQNSYNNGSDADAVADDINNSVNDGEAALAAGVGVDNEFDAEFAAEDEQYYEHVGVNFAGAEWSLEPEENSQDYIGDQCDGAEGIDVTEVVNSSSVEAHRTESSQQLIDSAAGGVNVNECETRESHAIEADLRNINEAHGASASGVGIRKSSSVNRETNIVAEQEVDCSATSSVNFKTNRTRENKLSVNNDSKTDTGQTDACAEQNIEQSDFGTPEGATGGQDLRSVEDKIVPEDELVAVTSKHLRSESVTEFYQPECDQSAMEESLNESSPETENIPKSQTGGNTSNNQCHAEADMMQASGDTNCDENPNINTIVTIPNEANSAMGSTVSPTHNTDLNKKDSEDCVKNERDKKESEILFQPQEKSSTEIKSDKKKNEAFMSVNGISNNDKGAIPKTRTNFNIQANPPMQNAGNTQHENRNDNHAKKDYCDKQSSSPLNRETNNITSIPVKDMKEVDSEDELLSELDATLQGTESMSAKTDKTDTKTASSAIAAKDTSAEGGQPEQSCEQCKKNNLKCSLQTSVSDKHASSVQEMKELKRQFHQAKQLLLDRECDISRLKDDLEEQYLRSESLAEERDSYRRDVQSLKHQNSDDLYIPQIKELEYTIAQQQNEVRGFKDKLSSHDGAAKRAIATLQNEMKLRLDQVTKMYEEANKEKDAMVMKFAQSEHKNLECQKAAERAEDKLRNMEKERDAFMIKMRAIKEQRTKLGAEVEIKTSEIATLNKDLDKHKEMLSSIDVRVKWAQNKLKAELEAHKDTKVGLDKMTIKLKEAKEETAQIRQNTQHMIKTYQESEEVKSNSLDKELKLKETELLENQMQKNSFELAHVKTQRELEQLKVELRESKLKCGALTDKITNLEGDHGQKTVTMNKYTEIIQRQKKEIKELQDRIETLVTVKSDFLRSQELIKSLDTEIAELKINNKDLTSEIEGCRRRETDRLDLTQKLSRKNAELQSENTNLSNKVLNLTGEIQATKMDNQDIDTKLKNVTDSLAAEQKLRQDENQTLNTKLAGECKAVEDLTRRVEEEKDEIKILKRKHTNNVKDLTRQLQQVRRKLESHEASTNGDKDTISMGSRTSSNGSLNTVSIAEQTSTQIVQPSTSHGPVHNQTHHRNPSPEQQEYPVITEQVEVDKQVLIERIVKLQRALARKNEKIEFMDDHISQLVDEIQKKNKIIQSYILKEETGTMTSNICDQAKAEISRKHSIMGSVYSSHSNDGTMTLDLSLEINRKLQAVLEDTLLKNMTLKESLDTLGQEIARLSQENRRLQLHIQGKSRVRGQNNR